MFKLGDIVVHKRDSRVGIVVPPNNDEFKSTGVCITWLFTDHDYRWAHPTFDEYVGIQQIAAEHISVLGNIYAE